MIERDIMKAYDFSKAKVICDETNNPPEVMETGQLHIDIIVPHWSGVGGYLTIPKDIDRFEEIK